MNWDKVTGSKDRHGSERDQRPAIDMDAKTGADFCPGDGGSTETHRREDRRGAGHKGQGRRDRRHQREDRRGFLSRR